MKKQALIFSFLLILFLFSSVVSADNLTIHFLDVEQADSAIVICDGNVLMIDGGNSSDSDLVFSYLKKTLKLDHLDYMIATHPHEDHIGGLAGALNACTVGKIYSPITEYNSRPFQSLKKYANKQGVAITIPAVGDSFELGSASVQFISPSKDYKDINNLSLVVRITYGNTSFLFTGDAKTEAEHDMVDSHYELESTLLKVGHHGSETSSSYVFLRDVMPNYAIISVGDHNKYGHPTEATLSRLSDAGAIIYRTDLHGTIICSSDGNTLSFSTEKNAVQKTPNPVE